MRQNSISYLIKMNLLILILNNGKQVRAYKDSYQICYVIIYIE